MNAPETDRFAFLGTGPVPVEPYVSAEYFELERERIFRREWLNVAREEELPAPGDFVVRDIEACNASLIVVRGADGRVARLPQHLLPPRQPAGIRKSGSAQALTCRYHGWSYGLDGAVKTITARERFAGPRSPRTARCRPCTATRGAASCSSTSRPSPGSRCAPSLGRLGRLRRELSLRALRRLREHALHPERQLESCAGRLPGNLPPGLPAPAHHAHMYFTPQDHTGSYLSADLYGPHRRFSIWANPAHRVPDSARVEQLARRYGATSTPAPRPAWRP